MPELHTAPVLSRLCGIFNDASPYRMLCLNWTRNTYSNGGEAETMLFMLIRVEKWARLLENMVITIEYSLKHSEMKRSSTVSNIKFIVGPYSQYQAKTRITNDTKLNSS